MKVIKKLIYENGLGQFDSRKDLEMKKGENKMHGILRQTGLALLAFFICSVAWAKPEVTLSIVSEKEVKEQQNGKEVVKRVRADEIEPGQVLIYTLTYSNKGDEKATNVVFDNQIPKEVVYVVGSASDEEGEVTFSINNGKDFKRPSMLTYEVKGQDGKIIKKKASPEQYTNIRWVISVIPPGKSGKLSYRAKVK